MYSYHHFMFPFRFDKVTKYFNDRHEFYKEVEFDERVVIDTKFKKNLENNDWVYKKFEINNNLDYNEFVYFHDFVKDSIYNLDEFKENATSYYFEKENIFNIFEIEIKNKLYKLTLKNISLRIFDTGVGILSIEAENHEHNSLEDILKINDFARRVYPQFLGEDFDVSKTKETFLPSKIKIDKYEESFSNFANEVKQKPFVKIGKHILNILGDTFSQKFECNKYLIQPIIDDRMFVNCWYGNDELVKNIDNKQDELYKYIFIDGENLTIQDKNMQQELIKQSVYTRWKNYNTLFGVTRYSFMCVTSSQETLKDNNAEFIINHMQTMYYQMAIILLTTRASILRFSDEITAISDIREDDKNLSKKVSILYQHYLRFVNKLYFREITPQDQGIELYEKALNVMKINRDIKDLENEIESLNSYTHMQEELKENKEVNKLTKVATYFMPATLVAGILGMNVFGEWMSKDAVFPILALIIVFYITLNPQKIIDLVIKDNDSK